jgi:hypothetical protein
MLKTGAVKALLMSIAVLAASMVGAAAGTWTEKEVSNGEIRGTLTLPETSSSFPAALIIAGSGPVDRDGNFARCAERQPETSGAWTGGARHRVVARG